MNSRFLLFLPLSLLFSIPVAAGPMTRNIEFVRPRIGQCGTTVDVNIQGVSLTNPREIIFYRPGIHAVGIQPAIKISRRGLMHGGYVDQEVHCRFVIAPDCPPGEHVFRLLTATELTVIGTFHVSPFPVIDENEPNNGYSNDTLESAKPVVGNVTIRGHLGNGSRTDSDLYRVEARAGQQLSVEVESARIADQHYGDSEFDLKLRILDKSGRAIAVNDDNSLHLQDPLASVRLPYDGPVYVEVQRSIFARRETIYCVHIGSYRRPLAAFPPGGQTGTKQRVKLLGDVLGEYEEMVSFPSRDTFGLPGSGTQTSRSRNYKHFGDGPSSLKLRCSPYPNILEDRSAAVTRVSEFPVALNGIIDSPTDVDVYRFSVKKKQRYHVRVFAASLGSPIDAVIRIRPINKNGKPGPVEVERDDSLLPDHDIFSTRFAGGGGLPEVIDPSIIWTPKNNGEYLLEIRDSSGAGGPTGVYRVEIEPPRTVVQTVLASHTVDWTESMRVSGLVIPRGNRWTVDLSLPGGQWNSLKSDFNLIAIGLPEGVRLVSPCVKAGASRWPLQFEADRSAKPGGTVITLVAVPAGSASGKSATNEATGEPPAGVQVIETRCQQNVPFINHPGGNAWRTVRMDRYVIGVTDPAPFSIDVKQPPVALVRGGKLAIPVQISRHDGFDGAIEVRCGNLPRSISTPPPLIIPPGRNEGLLELGAQSNAPLETVALYVIGSTMRDDIPDYLGAGCIRVSSRIVNLSVAQPYVELTAQPASIRRGEQNGFVWTVRHHTAFEGEGHVNLLGLPKGVTIIEPKPIITKDSTTITFKLKATAEALLGQATGLICEVNLPAGRQRIVQRTGRGKLRIDPRASGGEQK